MCHLNMENSRFDLWWMVDVASVVEIAVGLSTSTTSDRLTFPHIADGSCDDRRNAAPSCLLPPPSSLDDVADVGSGAEGVGDDCAGLPDAQVDVVVVHCHQPRHPHHTLLYWTVKMLMVLS